ncbi:terminase gpA endonuclease subunit [Escherichia coli]
MSEPGSEETLKAVVNTDIGRPYLPRSATEQRKSELLEQRAEPFPRRSVPDACVLLRQRLTYRAVKIAVLVQITGYGRAGGKRWIVDRDNIRHSLRCSPNGESLPVDPAAYPQDWDLLLTDVFHKTWPLASDPGCAHASDGHGGGYGRGSRGDR